MAVLFKQWKVVHATPNLDEYVDKGVCYESFCVGWCMAKGHSADDGARFYAYCIARGVY